MLLKISDGDVGWSTFDNVECTHFDRQPIKLRQEDIGTYEDLGYHILVSKKCFINKGEVLVAIVEFDLNGMHKKVIYSKVAFVLNNNGDTIDTYHVVERQEGKRK